MELGTTQLKIDNNAIVVDYPEGIRIYLSSLMAQYGFIGSGLQYKLRQASMSEGKGETPQQVLDNLHNGKVYSW